jgi:hypothetical protein
MDGQTVQAISAAVSAGATVAILVATGLYVKYTRHLWEETCAAIAWSDRGRAVVRETLASGRIWMVLLASRAHRAPDVVQGVLKEGQRGMCELACCFRRGR